MIILKEENPYIANGLIEYLGHRSSLGMQWVKNVIW